MQWARIYLFQESETFICIRCESKNKLTMFHGVGIYSHSPSLREYVYSEYCGKIVWIVVKIRWGNIANRQQSESVRLMNAHENCVSLHCCNGIHHATPTAADFMQMALICENSQYNGSSMNKLAIAVYPMKQSNNNTLHTYIQISICWQTDRAAFYSRMSCFETLL